MMMMTMESWSTLYFFLAVLHTFLCGSIISWSGRFPSNSLAHGVLHLLGEVEIVFGLWASVFLVHFSLQVSPQAAIDFQESLNFTEPLFVFAIMVVAASKPILGLAEKMLAAVAWGLHRLLRIPESVSSVFVLLFLGPLAGSFITEPAAMTVTALLLYSILGKISKPMIYFLISMLFVNISIGGALTPYAAPPILMVAQTWGWDFSFILQHFAWKTILATSLNAMIFCALFYAQIKEKVSAMSSVQKQKKLDPIPWPVTGIHLVFLILVILTAHHSKIFFGLFLLFLGVTVATQRYQSRLRFKESLLVAFFLGGIIVFGPMQRWWLEPLLQKLSESSLFFGAVGLTAITDNAALTYLGSQVSGLSDLSKYALVAGALAGGGLTLIANAPNAAGYSILVDLLPQKKLEPLFLFVTSLIPTAVAILCYWILPF